MQQDIDSSLARHLIKRIESLGMIKEKINRMCEHEFFENLSKHNIYFESDHELESNKLDDLRIALAKVKDELYEILSTLEANHYGD